ncbi:MAG: phosphoglycerate transporter, partial [SAR202 cluster bacterium]|nr:phosphoglycerate transporter [SAR202 cluster bacterium]
ELDAKIDFVFSNREEGEAEGSDLFFDLVGRHGLRLLTLSSRRLRREMKGLPPTEMRNRYDRRVMEFIGGYQPDICVLAGYMRIVSPEMCRRYAMVNLHPALPGGPAGEWQGVIWQLIESKANKTGAMIHLVTEELDQGPVLSYFTLPLDTQPFRDAWRQMEGQPVAQLKQRHGEDLPLFKLIRQAEYRREPYLLLETLKSLAGGDVRIKDRQVVDAAGKLVEGVDLTKDIERQLKASA